MDSNKREESLKEELLSSQPPPYEAINNSPPQQQQQQPVTVVVNNTTVVQQGPIVYVAVELENDFLCRETPKEVRRIFIRNLFLMIAAQFLLIDGIIAMLVFVPFIHDNMMDKRNSSNFYIIWIVSIIILAVISFWERARRIPPANYVTMIIFTICQGMTLGCAAMYKEMALVLLASVGTTGVVCLATALFELQGRYYLGNFRSVLYVWALNATCFSISLSFLTCNQAGFAAGLSTLFCTYLVVNAQMMVHGTTRYVLTPREYVFGAMNIYVDIVHGMLICLAGIGICGCGIFTCCRVCKS